MSNNAHQRGWQSAELERLLGSKWHVQPGAEWRAENIALTMVDTQKNNGKCLFIAIDEKTWHAGSGNTGIYAGWKDTHEVLKNNYHHFCGAIVQHYLAELPDWFPQMVVENTYDVLPVLADEARRRMNGAIIAITGTVGKSSTKDLLHMLLAEEGATIATQGNHNTRTGTMVSLARCITDPQYAVLEVAISALWMQSGGAGTRIKPHIVIITEIGMTQVGRNVKTLRDTARFKTRLCNAILPGGYAILNRDMDEYDFVSQEAIRYGARVISYGFHPQADVPVTNYAAETDHSIIEILFNGTAIKYQLNVPGKGMARNSVAALIAIHFSGGDINKAAGRIADYRNHKNKLQTGTMTLPGGGSVTLIDDNYNATLTSMCNAFEVASLYQMRPGQRRVAVLGRLATLGELAKESHIALAEPLLQAGFDRVWLHGEEMRDLMAVLPAGRVSGHFTRVDEMAESVMAGLKAGDVVLVKGSVSDSDFHQIVRRMKNISRRAAPALKEGQTAGVLINLSRGELVVSCHADAVFEPLHLSHLLLITQLAARQNKNNSALTTPITAKTVPAGILQKGPALGLKAGQEYSVKCLLQAMIIHNARDAAVNLAHYLAGDTAAALSRVQAQAKALKMTQTQISNVSGRLWRQQQTTVQDIAQLVRHFYHHFPHFLHWFAESEMVSGERLYRKSSNIQAAGRASYSYSSGGTPRWGFAIHRHGGELWLACAAGADDAFHLDYLLDELLAQAEGEATVVNDEQVITFDKNDITVALLGDTYCGEWYTRQRQRRGIDDGLQRYGYDHAFLGIAPLLAGSDLTIANFEAALTESTQGTLAGRKPFCLTGDPLATTVTLKNHGIDAVTLANNHAMDAGIAGLRRTLDAFHQQGISTFGAGMNATQAHAPLTLAINDRRFKFFSAYWFRQYMEQDCAFYAQPRRAGVACISGGLTEKLREEKRSDDPATLIVLAHWGQDYQWTRPQQRQLAKRLMDAGADLIIGSGPHIPGDILRTGQGWVLYSIGNGVFNSNGEYQSRGMPPYGFIVRLSLGGTQPALELQPIFTDNQQTFWQPRPVSETEFEHVITILREQGTRITEQPRQEGAWIKRQKNARPVIVLPLDIRFAGR